MEPLERRRSPRIHFPIPVKVRGNGYELETVVDDLGAGGICLRLPREVAIGESLSFLVEFSMTRKRKTTEPIGRRAPRISARGIVMRVRDLEDGTFQLAAKFTHYVLV